MTKSLFELPSGKEKRKELNYLFYNKIIILIC